MKKFRLYWDTEKETEWLNQMAKDGWNITGFTLGLYNFEKCEPGEYQYQIDTSDKLFNVSDKYKEFMESIGVEIVCCWGPWVVLRRKASEGEFQLYSDDESKLEHLKKILKIYKIVAIIELICMMVNVIPATLHNSFENLICAMLISLFVFLFCYMIYVTKRRINRILNNQGEKTETANKTPLLYSTIGWLFLMCGNLVNRSDSTLMDIVAIVCAFVACVFFGLSIGATAANKKK